MHAGYLQVTPLSGHGPALLVLPDGKTPFEAYNPILGARAATGPSIFRDLTPRGITFEGFYDWMVHSAAFAENEWKRAKPWNPPTQLTLAAGESKTYGVTFVLADSIRDIAKTLEVHHRPVAIGIPGYILPTDLEGELFLNSPQAVKSIARRKLDRGLEAIFATGKALGTRPADGDLQRRSHADYSLFCDQARSSSASGSRAFSRNQTMACRSPGSVSSKPFLHELRPRGEQDRHAGQPGVDCRPR